MMGRRSVVTRELAPTTVSGARIRARSDARTVIVARREGTEAEAHERAARTLLEAEGQEGADVLGARLPQGGWVFVVLEASTGKVDHHG